MTISKKVTRDTKVTRDIFENRNVTGYFLCHGEKKNNALPRPDASVPDPDDFTYKLDDMEDDKLHEPPGQLV